jgi:hypothetical protein
MAIPSDEELAKMSLPELEKLLDENQKQLSENYRSLQMLEQQEQPMEQAAPAADPTPAMKMDEFGMGMTPEKVQAATAKLVSAGMLDAASAEITPELVAKMQTIADQIDPGLYDLSQPDQLMEFIDGINSGTIDIKPAAPVGQPAQPLLQGGAAGIPTGGLPPAGAGAEPAPIL